MASLNWKRLLAPLTLAASALAQASSSYTDSGITWQGLQETTHGTTWGFVFPPLDSTGPTATEFVGQIIVPSNVGWAGLAYGGQMANNLLMVAWPNTAGTDAVISARWAT
jgi:cellobiose dehydrogenase (acceptor)